MNNEGMADRIGSEPLSTILCREELAALADDVRYVGGNGTSEYWRGFNDGIDKFLDRLATLDAARSEPVAGLDVERLARALQPGHDFIHEGDTSDCEFADEDAARSAAIRIAAEYAALHTPEEPRK